MSIADFFFGRKQNSTNSRRSVKLNQNAVRTRTLSMEPLETRDLLSVTTGLIDDSAYDALRTQYPDFNLPNNQSDLNVMTVDCNLADLKSAITKADSSTKPDLILVKTTDDTNTITYSTNSNEITLNIDSETKGSVTIIGWGSKELTLNANEKCRLMSITGTSDVYLGNLIITNGKTGRGGGINSTSTGSLTLCNCSITSNVAYDSTSSVYGGGIYSSSNSILALFNCTISNNKANAYYYTSSGGGIYCSANSMFLNNCIISGNEASVTPTTYSNTALAAYGGGIYSSSNSALRLTNCTVTNNKSTSIASSEGSGIFNSSVGDLLLDNCIIANNNSHGLYSDSNVTIVNCTITNNSNYGICAATKYNSSYNPLSYTVKIYNSIIALNKTSNNYNDIARGSNSITVSVYNSLLSSYPNLSNEIDNIVYDSSKPLFVSSSNYQLANNSQAINKGNNSYAVDSSGLPLSIDLAGIPRILGGTVDLGAYEYDSRTALSNPEFSAIANETSAIVNISPVVNAVAYRIEYSLNDDFTDRTTIEAQEGENVLNDLQFLQTYYVRVKSIGNDDYIDSDYSVAQSFIIIPALTGLTLSTDAPEVGSTIIATIDSPYATVEYQWYCGETAIVGATESSFTVTAEQYGQTITCVVAGTGYYSQSFSATTAETVKFATPDGYNDNDYQKMVAFLEQTDSNGRKNGTKINTNYDPANPSTWNNSGYGVYWTVINGEKSVTSLRIEGKSLVGSADFSNIPNLKTLKCSNNQLTSLDVSMNSALETLECNNSQLTVLNISGCTVLASLSCYNNQISSLDFSDCTSLKNLSCFSNQLTQLDLSDKVSLTFISCYSNPIESINISGCTQLQTFSFAGGSTSNSVPLKTLDASGCTALTSLNCYYGHLTSLNVSGCISLQTLDCHNNQLTELDVSSCSALTNLDCGYNQLAELDVSGCSELINLSCNYNQLTSLLTSNLTALTKLYCFNNQLTSLDISGCNNLTSNNILFHSNPLEHINISGCTALTSFSCKGSFSQSTELKTLNASGCTSLQTLECYYGQLTSLDVSDCSALTSLDCSYNQLTSLDVSSCTSLTDLKCNSNQLTSLNVFGASELTTLDCSVNQLNSLDVSGCTELINLDCHNNLLTNLNLSNNSKLTTLSCNGMSLSSLDVSMCNELTTLSCQFNQIKTLNVSNCAKLTYLDCSQQLIRTLDLSDCSSLETLWCNNLLLSTLDVSNNTSLKKLYCYKNKLTSINVSSCSELTLLSCFDNLLTSLDVSNHTSLTNLYCYSNPLITLNASGCAKLKSDEFNFSNDSLESLDVSNCTALTYLTFSDKQLAELNASNCTSLKTLTCNNNLLTSLNVSGCRSLLTLNCNQNRLTSLEVDTCTGLYDLSCNNNLLSSLDVSLNSELTYLDCGENPVSFLDLSNNLYLSLLKIQNASDLLLVRLSNGLLNEISIDFINDFIISNSNNTITSSVYTPTELPFTASSLSGSQTIGFYSDIIPLIGLTLSPETPEVGTVITAALTLPDATAEYQWYSGTDIISGAMDSSFTVTTEQIGQTLTCIATGTGNYTGTVSVTTSIVPAIILKTPAVSLSHNKSVIDITWTGINNSSGYVVEYKFGDSDWSVLTTTAETTATLTGQSGIEYAFRVKAIGTDVYADSDYSEVQTVTIAETLDAHNDFVKTTLNSPVVIDYRENDDVMDWSVVTVQFGEASHGEYVVNEDGTISYTPENGFFGTDTIGYALFSPSGKASVGSISISVGLPIATSVQKTSGSHSPSTAMAPSVDSLTDWDNCCVELWAQGVNELNSGETTVTLEYNPAVYETPYFSACAEGVALAASEGVVLPNGNVEIQLTVHVLEPLESQTDNLFLGTVVLTPSEEEGSGVEDVLTSEPVCVLDGSELTTTVEAMPYDLVRNGAVDVNDFVAFATIFGTNLETMSPDNPLYAQAVKADFNNDKIVNVDDFVMFAIKFGATKKRVEIPAAQASAAAESGNREWETGSGEVIDSQVETPVAQSAAPASQLVTRNSQLESSMTLLEAYSAALLDLYDNQESFDPAEPSAVLAESRTESPVARYSDGSSQKTSFDAVDAVLEEDLLTIDWE